MSPRIKSLLMHDTTLRDLYQKILPLLQSPPDLLKPEIGFRVEEGKGTPYRAGSKQRGGRRGREEDCGDRPGSLAVLRVCVVKRWACEVFTREILGGRVVPWFRLL